MADILARIIHERPPREPGGWPRPTHVTTVRERCALANAAGVAEAAGEERDGPPLGPGPDAPAPRALDEAGGAAPRRGPRPPPGRPRGTRRRGRARPSRAPWRASSLRNSPCRPGGAVRCRAPERTASGGTAWRSPPRRRAAAAPPRRARRAPSPARSRPARVGRARGALEAMEDEQERRRGRPGLDPVEVEEVAVGRGDPLPPRREAGAGEGGGPGRSRGGGAGPPRGGGCAS